MGRTDINLTSKSRLMFKCHMNDRVEGKATCSTMSAPAHPAASELGRDARLRPHAQQRDVVNSRLGWTRFGDYE